MEGRRYDIPPKNRRALEQRLRNVIADTELQQRARRQLGYVALAATLMRHARDEHNEPLFLIKGGVAVARIRADWLRAWTGRRSRRPCRFIAYGLAINSTLGTDVRTSPAIQNRRAEVSAGAPTRGSEHKPIALGMRSGHDSGYDHRVSVLRRSVSHFLSETLELSATRLRALSDDKGTHLTYFSRASIGHSQRH